MEKGKINRNLPVRGSNWLGTWKGLLQCHIIPDTRRMMVETSEVVISHRVSKYVEYSTG